MSCPAHVFLEVGGLRLHHLRWRGADPPVVCLHGVTGHAWVWHDVASELARRGRSVLSLDLRGHGDSQWSADGRYATDDHVRDLAARLELLGIDAPHLVGASWGGLIALAFAAAHPDRARSLSLVDAAPSFAGSETDVPMRPGTFADHATLLAFEREANPHAPERLLSLAAAHGTRPSAGGGLERKHDPLFLERWPFRADDRWAQLEACELPVLVVHARESAVVSAQVAARMARTAARARLVEIADCGHVVPLERPQELALAIARFTSEEER